jgi:hypothetical protein
MLRITRKPTVLIILLTISTGRGNQAARNDGIGNDNAASPRPARQILILPPAL